MQLKKFLWYHWEETTLDLYGIIFQELYSQIGNDATHKVGMEA